MPNPRIRPPRETSRSESAKGPGSDTEVKKIVVYSQLTPLDQPDDSVRHAIINQMRKYRGVYVKIKRDPNSIIPNDRIAVLEFNDIDACNYFKQAILERRDRIVVFDKILFFDFAQANRQMQEEGQQDGHNRTRINFNRHSPRHFNHRRLNQDRSPHGRVPRPPLAPSRTLFVGNLDENDEANELKKYFEPFGELLEIVVKRPSHPGTSPYAFVKYKTMNASLSAKDKLQDTFVGGRRVKIGFGKVTATHAIWIGGFDENITEDELITELKTHGNFVNHSFDSTNLMCYLIFQSLEDSRRAFHEFSSMKIPDSDRKLQVDYADTQNEVKHLLEGVEIKDGRIRKDSISSKDSSQSFGSERSHHFSPDIQRSVSPKNTLQRRVGIKRKRNRSVSSSSSSMSDERIKISSSSRRDNNLPRKNKIDESKSIDESMDVSPLTSNLMDLKDSPNGKSENHSESSPISCRTRTVRRSSKISSKISKKTKDYEVKNKPIRNDKSRINNSGMEIEKKNIGRNHLTANYTINNSQMSSHMNVFPSPGVNNIQCGNINNDSCSYFPQILSSYPVGWRGKVVVKNSIFPLRMYLVCGNVEVVSKIVHQATLSGIDPTSIYLDERFQLLPDRIIELRNKFASAIAGRDCCVLVAQQQEQIDRKDDLKNHNTSYKPISSLISHLLQKQSAGIGSIASSSIYMFPPSQFTYEQLTTLMPHAVTAITNCPENYLMVLVSR